jgi:hypothetical protein
MDSARKPSVLFVPMPHPSLDYHLEAARRFADGLADRLRAAAGEPAP